MTEKKTRRKSRKFRDEFKQQIVALYQSEKRKKNICREYDLSQSLLDRWIKQATTTGSFRDKDEQYA